MATIEISRVDELNRIGAISAEERLQLLRRLGREVLNGSTLVAEGLRRSGVKRLFGIGGTPVDAVVAQASRRHLRVISTRHQNSATLTAAAANYLSGSLENAVVVSAGPAVTNAMTGVLVARDNHWPLLLMGGRRALKREGSGYFQEMDAVPMMRPITKWAATIPSADQIVPYLRKAVETSTTGLPGPVYLDLPEDVLTSSAALESTQVPQRPIRVPPEDSDVERVLAMVRAARRPLLLLGEDLRWSVEPGSLAELIERQCIPFISTSLARGIVSDEHPLCCNTIRHQVPGRSDLVLLAGAWFDWRFRHGVELAPNAQIVHVHPDEQLRGRNVDATLTVAADGGLFLNQLATRSRDVARATRIDWISELTPLLDASHARHAAWRSVRGPTISPQGLYDVILRTIPDDTFLILDGGVHLAVGQHLVRVRRPLSWLDPTWSGCIGVGIPFGMAARLSFPQRPVVVVTGDTGFGLSGMELEAAARYKLPFVVIVVNNDGVNGRVRQNNMLPDQADPFYTFSSAIRYDTVASALGTTASQFVDTLDAFEETLRDAVRSSDPTCINARVEPMAPVPPVW